MSFGRRVLTILCGADGQTEQTEQHGGHGERDGLHLRAELTASLPFPETDTQIRPPVRITIQIPRRRSVDLSDRHRRSTGRETMQTTQIQVRHNNDNNTAGGPGSWHAQTSHYARKQNTISLVTQDSLFLCCPERIRDTPCRSTISKMKTASLTFLHLSGETDGVIHGAKLAK